MKSSQKFTAWAARTSGPHFYGPLILGVIVTDHNVPYNLLEEETVPLNQTVRVPIENGHSHSYLHYKDLSFMEIGH